MAITVTPTVEPGNWPPRIRLNVSASAGESSTTVQRLNPDGNTVPVRTGDGNPLPLLAGVGLIYDYEPPFGLAVSYTSTETPANVSAQVSVDVTQVWLIHPGVPTLSAPINLRPGSLQEELLPVKQGVFQVMGRTNPVVVTDGARKGSQSSLVLYVQTQNELDSLKSLLADANVLLLNIPDGMNVGFDSSYVAIGDVKISRWTDVQIDWNRDITLPLTVVDRPAGGSQAQRTWLDVLAAYPTWSAVMAAYPTWNSLLAGP